MVRAHAMIGLAALVAIAYGCSGSNDGEGDATDDSIADVTDADGIVDPDVPPDTTADVPDDTADVERIVETHELQRIVNSVLSTLTAEQRLLITLRDFEQLSYEEISLITETSLSNVKSRLHRARMAFKDKFKPYLKLLREG